MIGASVRSHTGPSASSDRRRSVISVGVALVSIIVAWAWGRWLQAGGTRLFTGLPPLTGVWDPSLTWHAVPALLLGTVAVLRGPALARRLSWRGVLWSAAVAALAWSASLAFTEGIRGFVDPPAAPTDYLASVGSISDLHGFLGGFVDSIGSYSTHVRAHPPGMVLLVWAMGRAGLSGSGWVALLEHSAAAIAVPAVLLSVREVADDAVARRAAPFLILLPAASAVTSGDALFLGVSAWAVAAVVLATSGGSRLRSDLLAVAGGLAFGAGLLLSYGLVLVAVVPVAVAVARRRPRPLLVALIGAAVMLGAAALVGFDWFAGLAATRREYALSIARYRPYGYFLFANLAAVAIVLGPAVWAALPRLRDRRLWLLVGSGVAAVLVADVSGLSKAEVERIWLPFMPWVALATGAAFASEGEERGWLAAQVGWAIVLELAVVWPW
jgi:hypothetical protein